MQSQQVSGVRRTSRRSHVLALCGYLAVAICFTWPLGRHLGTHLPGAPDGDTGVYVWNLWVFHYELVEHRTLPYFTDRIFRETGRANLSLHNYTAFANVLALPFVGRFGILATFNAVYIAMTVLTAWAMFLLARRLCDDDPWIAWLAGLTFAWCPFLATRGMGHYSLVAAAPLPIFVLLLMRLKDRYSFGDSVALGITVAWATACDVYYGVYCVMLAAGVLAVALVRVRRIDSPPVGLLFLRALDVLALCVAGLVLVIAVGSGWQFAFLGRVVRIRTVYTPLLILELLILVRASAGYRLTLGGEPSRQWRNAPRLVAIATLVATVIMSPFLLAIGERVQSGQFVRPHIFWRSSPPGIDLLAWLTPNPNHPLAPASLQAWQAALTRDGYLENVASIPLVAVGLIALAFWRGWRPSRAIVIPTIACALLACGPFVRVDGVDTHMPGPWALLRYVPIVGLARSPSRLSVLVMLGVAMLCAGALRALVQRRPNDRRMMLAIVSVATLFELLPAPRRIYDGQVPTIYRVVAADPRMDASVLELPFGIRDGTMAVGNLTSRTQYYQTAHAKPILGGYLSRVSRRHIAQINNDLVLRTLIALSEGKAVADGDTPRVAAQWPEFVRRTAIAYVVVDSARASPALQSFIATTLELREVAVDRAFHLYKLR